MIDQHEAREMMRRVALTLVHLWLGLCKNRHSDEVIFFISPLRDLEREIPGKHIRVTITLEDWKE